jgi:hypothetical protein
MDKDWTGNKNSCWYTLCASNHAKVDTERQVNDYYATYPKALELLLNKLKQDNVRLHNDIWECACGEGHLSKLLIDKGYHVYSSDKVDRGYGKQQDFLKISNMNNLHYDILTNPPYKYAQDFIEKALNIIADDYYVVMFLKIQFLEGKTRRRLYEQGNLKYVYVNSERQMCAKNGDFHKYKNNAMCYCWFIWQKGFKGNPIIRWL